MSRSPIDISDNLRVFQKVNPSVSPIEETGRWQQFAARMQHRFMDEYRLPPAMFRNAAVLDVGCGTGEKTMVFASWGGRVTGMDYNEKALERARYLASISRHREQINFLKGSLPNLPSVLKTRRFDITFADGVLHHTADPVHSLSVLAERMAKGGWFIIRNYQHIPAFQRIIKRFIVRLGSGDKDEIIEDNARRLFAEDIERSVRLGGRDEKQAIYDNFVLPHYKPLNQRDILKTCNQNGLQLYATSTVLDAPAFIGPGMKQTQLTQPEDLSQLWWVAGLAKIMTATDGAPESLELVKVPLQRCAKSGMNLEESLYSFGDDPSGEHWDVLIKTARQYLMDFRVLSKHITEFNSAHFATFISELEQIQETIREAIDQDRRIEQLPQTDVLFRKMSGSPMTSWVLHKPAAMPSSPF